MDARPPVSAEVHERQRRAQQGGPSAKNAGKRCGAGRAARGGEQQSSPLRLDTKTPDSKPQTPIPHFHDGAGPTRRTIQNEEHLHPCNSSPPAPQDSSKQEENGKCQSRAQEDRGQTSSRETAGQAKKPRGPGKDDQK
ncbi:Hypothetical predicted protein [Pelobates cultripes]|uniref:Uncharacterized protein n=1 Tax=Pelobates cultripes TaxID=61616 RepID=A0AAD1S0N9_PELCU|nr:Hypothetical predicted protein [Pelobates cultripes]